MGIELINIFFQRGAQLSMVHEKVGKVALLAHVIWTHSVNQCHDWSCQGWSCDFYSTEVLLISYSWPVVAAELCQRVEITDSTLTKWRFVVHTSNAALIAIERCVMLKEIQTCPMSSSLHWVKLDGMAFFTAIRVPPDCSFLSAHYDHHYKQRSRYWAAYSAEFTSRRGTPGFLPCQLRCVPAMSWCALRVQVKNIGLKRRVDQEQSSKQNHRTCLHYTFWTPLLHALLGRLLSADGNSSTAVGDYENVALFFFFFLTQRSHWDKACFTT